jgi:hypothetical protein
MKIKDQTEEAEQLIQANLRAEKEAERLSREREQAETAMDEVEKQAELLAEQKALAELQLQESSEEAQRREEEAVRLYMECRLFNFYFLFSFFKTVALSVSRIFFNVYTLYFGTSFYYTLSLYQFLLFCIF